MKITSKILRSEIDRIMKEINGVYADGSNEQYLLEALDRVANALDAIHNSNNEESGTYRLTNSFQLDTEIWPGLSGDEPLNENESNPTNLWAEIWKLRSHARGPGEYETWRDAAIDEKQKRIAAERTLEQLKNELRGLLFRS